MLIGLIIVLEAAVYGVEEVSLKPYCQGNKQSHRKLRHLCRQKL